MAGVAHQPQSIPSSEGHQSASLVSGSDSGRLYCLPGNSWEVEEVPTLPRWTMRDSLASSHTLDFWTGQQRPGSGLPRWLSCQPKSELNNSYVTVELEVIPSPEFGNTEHVWHKTLSTVVVIFGLRLIGLDACLEEHNLKWLRRVTWAAIIRKAWKRSGVPKPTANQ